MWLAGNRLPYLKSMSYLDWLVVIGATTITRTRLNRVALVKTLHLHSHFSVVLLSVAPFCVVQMNVVAPENSSTQE
jgi:hypothetical protein